MSTLGDALVASNPDLAAALGVHARAPRRERGGRGSYTPRNGAPTVRGASIPVEIPDYILKRKPMNADPLDPDTVKRAWNSYVQRKRVHEMVRRAEQCERRYRELQREEERRRAKALPAHLVKVIGRLVIITDTDLPCVNNIAVAYPGDREGLVCAYLDSERYNHSGAKAGRGGWWFEPTGGGAIDLADYGMGLDVYPREGAWSFKVSARPQLQAKRQWSSANVGSSVLHIRFKSEIEAGRAAPPKPEEIEPATSEPSAALSL